MLLASHTQDTRPTLAARSAGPFHKSDPPPPCCLPIRHRCTVKHHPIPALPCTSKAPGRCRRHVSPLSPVTGMPPPSRSLHAATCAVLPHALAKALGTMPIARTMLRSILSPIMRSILRRQPSVHAPHWRSTAFESDICGACVPHAHCGAHKLPPGLPLLRLTGGPHCTIHAMCHPQTDARWLDT